MSYDLSSVADRQGKTESLARITKVSRRLNQLLYPEKDFWRPQLRSECVPCSTCQAFKDGKLSCADDLLPCGHPKEEALGHCRPCAFVGCKYHLLIDIGRSGQSLRYSAEAEPWDIDPKASCALDLADQGPMKLQDIGDVLGITRERIRQIEEKAIQKLAQVLAKDPQSQD